jgi:hypothetical protein
MKFNSILFLLALSLSACSVNDTQSFETTVTVTDISGKPLVDKTVKVFIEMTNTNFVSPNAIPFVTAKTNSAGQVVLKYQLFVTESSQNSAIITVDDDVKWKAIARAGHTYLSSKKRVATLDYTILMDTLGDFKVRLKKTSNTPLYLSLSSWNAYPQNYTERKFFDWGKTNVMTFDSILTMRVYANSDFYLFCNAQTAHVTPKNREISATAYRDSVYTILIQ